MTGGGGGAQTHRSLRGKAGRILILITHHHLVPRFIMSVTSLPRQLAKETFHLLLAVLQSQDVFIMKKYLTA